MIFERIKAQLPSWSEVTFEQARIKRMDGLSNACYRVSVEKPVVSPDAVLYKKFECKIINKDVEALIFKNMSDRGYGPKYIY